MITRVLLLVLVSALLTGPSAAQDRKTFSFVYLSRTDDPVYEPHRAYTGLQLRDRHRPVDGARTALKESRILGRALGLKFALIEESLSAEEPALGRIRKLMDEGSSVFILDLPLAEMQEVAAALVGEAVILFNVRHGDDTLRGSGCSPVLFHTLPSDAMRMDALAQFLFKKNWRQVLILQGEQEADVTLSEAFQASARKFGLTIADVRDFVLSNDPRERDRNNIALLTAGAGYDAVFLADSIGEVGRYVPFNTKEPRPVVGSEGLLSAAWHWTWERHGAPQLNQRFGKQAKRRMSDEDWAAWAALKVVVEAISRTNSTAVPDITAYLRSDRLTFDNYKGSPSSFRSWNNQLRQPILLHSHNAVIGRAPFEGFLHRRNTLDTLGSDEPEGRCRFP